MKVESFIRHSQHLQIGKAGEYLTCSDLITKGLVAFPSEQGLPYDVVIDTGVKILKVQVKTTEKSQKVNQRINDSLSYTFHTKRRGNKNNVRGFTKEDCDLFAFVSLETKQVAYMKVEDVVGTIRFRVDAKRGTYYGEKYIHLYDEIREKIKTKKPQAVAWDLKINKTVVERAIKRNYSIPWEKIKYMGDLSRDTNWFLKL